MKDAREIELKLDLDPDATERFMGYAEATLGRPREIAKRLSSTYFDTARHALRRRSVSLRLRDDGERRTQTLKASRNGLFDRAEWEVETHSDRPEPKAFPEAEPRRILEARGALARQFETRFERTTWLVVEGTSSVEVALDRGAVVADGSESPLCEVELELKTGSPDDLFAVAQRLAGTGHLRVGVMSKSERGYALLAGHAVAPIKAEPVDLTLGMSAGEAFQAVARSCLRQFRLNEPILLDTRHADVLHQNRVAIRRLRSALSLFKNVAVDDVYERMKRELRALSTLLGEARNLDVYRDLALAHETERDPDLPGLAEYKARVAQDREEAYDRVVDELQSRRFRLFTVDLAAWIEAGPWLTRIEGHQDRDQPVWTFATGELDRRRRAVKKKGRKLEALDESARHQVRIAAKKLRYASEFFGSLTKGAKARHRQAKFVARLETLQDCLGALNDILTGRVLAQRLSERFREDGPIFAAGQGAGGQDGREDSLVTAAAKAHAKFVDAKPFWR